LAYDLFKRAAATAKLDKSINAGILMSKEAKEVATNDVY
jgi:hypothetical protein